jgi:hypothetical protein
MKLLTKVNPDMINQKEPMSPPSIDIIPPAAMSTNRQELPPLKMLPDLDKEEPKEKEAAEPEGEDDDIMTHLNKELKPFDDQQEKEKDKEEAFGNSVGDSEPDYKDIGASLPNGNDLNRPKKSFSGKPYRGDNPMAAGAYESKETLRATIRTELLQRLAEAKGAK